MRAMKKSEFLRNYWRLLGYARAHRWWVAAMLVTMALNAGANGAKVYFIKPLVDEGLRLMKGVNAAVPAGTAESLWLVAVCVLLLAPVIFASNVLQSYCSWHVLWSTLLDIRNELCGKLLPQPLTFFEDRRAGELMSRLTNDIAILYRALLCLYSEIIVSFLQLVAFLATAVWASWQLSIASVIIFPIVGTVMGVLGRRVKRYARVALERLADLTEAMHQMFSGIRIVKAFGMEDAEAKEFRKTNARYFRNAMKSIKAKAISDGLVDFIGNAGLFIVVLGGGYVLLRPGTLGLHLSPGQLFMFVASIALMFTPIRRLAKAYNSLMESLPGATRVFELLDTTPTIQDAPDAVEMPPMREGIRFDHVTFAYNTAPVLRDVSLCVKPGEIVALVGHSGAGKSTLCDLIARFRDPQEGAITVDGVDLRKIKQRSLLKHIAIVSQQPFLFNRTLAGNIRYGKPDASEAEVIAAATAANIHDFIVSLANGYESGVGEMGGKLSGGQRQRVTIARAFLKNASILILDEATSSLDSESEKLIQDALQKLMQGRTTFVIAHRLSTVKFAHRIVVLRQGRIIEMGTHDELLAKGGEYNHLYKMQFGAGEKRE